MIDFFFKKINYVRYPIDEGLFRKGMASNVTRANGQLSRRFTRRPGRLQRSLSVRFPSSQPSSLLHTDWHLLKRFVPKRLGVGASAYTGIRSSV